MKKKTFEVVLDPPLNDQGVDYVNLTIEKCDINSLRWFADLVKDRVVAVYDLDDEILKELFGDVFE